jgi:hypothetical protein
MSFFDFQSAAKIDTNLTLETKSGENVSFNQTKFDQSLCDQSPLVINFFEINCVAINPADAADRVAIDQRS